MIASNNIYNFNICRISKHLFNKYWNINENIQKKS